MDITKGQSRIIKFLMLFLSQGLNKIVGFFFLPFLARSLSYDDYGTYGQVLLTGNMTLRLFSFGLATVIFVFYARNEGRESAIFQSNFMSIVAVGSLASILGYIFAEPIARLLENSALFELIRVYIWVVPLLMLNTALDSTLIYFNRIKQSAIILVISNIIAIVSMVVCVMYFYSITNLIYAIFFGHIFKFVILLFFIPKQLIQSVEKFSASLVKEQLWIGFPLGLTLILGFLFKYTDSIMISNLLGTQEYAIYRNGAIELPFVAAFYGAITKIILPDVTKYFSKAQFNEIASLKRKLINYNAIVIYPVVIYLILFSEPLIVLYLSEKYHASAYIFAVYTLLLLFRINNYGDIFTAANKNFYQSVIYIAVIIINVPLNYFLISRYGSVGAAYATVIAMLLLVIMLLVQSTKIIGKSVKDLIDFSYVGKVLGVSIIAGLLSYSIYSKISNMYALIACSAIYFIGTYIFYLYRKWIPLDLISFVNGKITLPGNFYKKISNYYSI